MGSWIDPSAQCWNLDIVFRIPTQKRRSLAAFLTPYCVLAWADLKTRRRKNPKMGCLYPLEEFAKESAEPLENASMSCSSLTPGFAGAPGLDDLMAGVGSLMAFRKSTPSLERVRVVRLACWRLSPH